MVGNGKTIRLRVLEVLIAVAALVAAGAGIGSPAVYSAIVPEAKMPFVFTQDVITVAAALLLLVMTFSGSRGSMKRDIVRLGIIGYLFYAFGPYVMGTLYTSFYLLYMAVGSLTLFYFMVAFSGGTNKKLAFGMPQPLRLLIVVVCLAIPAFFTPQWIIAIVNNIRNNVRPETTGFALNYYVYILDLCFLLPVCVIAAVLLFRKNPLGFLLGGILPIKGFTLMLSVAAGFFCQPLFHQEMIVAGGAVLFSVLTAAFLLLSIAYFVFTKIEKKEEAPSA
jgi:hypothetical protein